MPGRARKLSDDTEREIVEAYNDTTTSVMEIKQAYSLTNGLLYSVLRRAGVSSRVREHNKPWRPDHNGHAVPADPYPEPDPQADPYPELVRLPIAKVTTVTIDSHATVTKVERQADPDSGPLWLVLFQGAMEVNAHSIDQALNEARKLKIVRTITSVSQKQ